MDVHKAFRYGAEKLAAANCEYTDLHKGHGIDEEHWKLLTQDEYWTPDQARRMRSIIASALEVSMTIAGMPAIPLPGQYVAALIAIVVSPCNHMIACMKAPDTFDAHAASGILEPFEIKEMQWQQLMSLVILYGSGFPGEPRDHKLSKEVVKQMKKENEQ